MPLVSIVVGLLNTHLLTVKKQSSFTKETLRSIISLTQSSREKELVRYTALMAGNFSQTSARDVLGLENINKRVAEVEKCIDEAKEIREAINQIVQDEICSLCLIDSAITLVTGLVR